MILKFLNITQARHAVPLPRSTHNLGCGSLFPKWTPSPIISGLLLCYSLARAINSVRASLKASGIFMGLVSPIGISSPTIFSSITHCLKIIDFDFALEVKDDNEEVHDQCGTKNLMAPEVEKNSMYSPIKADRWSCGRVILYLLDKFKNEDKHFRPFANKLTVHDPIWRPSLFEWASYATLLDVANVSNTCVQLLQVNSSEDTPLPEAKKRRLAGSD